MEDPGPGDQEGPEPAANETEDPGNDQAPDDEDDQDEDGGEDDRQGDDEDEDDEQGDEEDDHPPWPSPGNASIRPGVQVSSPTGTCTTNFVFRTPSNSSLMLGTAAHCFAENVGTNADGCDEEVSPLEPGTEASIEGASEPGILLYSSWFSMQKTNETNEAACQYNDFALVLIPDAEREEVSPALLGYGGPTDLAEAGSATTGDKVLWYGSSSYRQGMEELQANEGYVLSSNPWSAVMYGAPPGVPGDSGSAVTLGSGQALGILNTVRVTPEPGSNGITLLEPALEYALGMNVPVELVTWEQFDEGALPG